jgi:hypothetical protein
VLTSLSRLFVGDHGLTYPYFDRRMFLIPWEDFDGIVSEVTGDDHPALRVLQRQIASQLGSPSPFNMALINHFHPSLGDFRAALHGDHLPRVCLLVLSYPELYTASCHLPDMSPDLAGPWRASLYPMAQ